MKKIRERVSFYKRDYPEDIDIDRYTQKLYELKSQIRETNTDTDEGLEELCQKLREKENQKEQINVKKFT